MFLELLFAGDCALIAHAEGALQRIVYYFAEVAVAFSQANLKETEVMHQPPPEVPYTHNTAPHMHRT